MDDIAGSYLELSYPKPRSYQAKVDRTIDGDTVVLDVDVGFDLTVKAKCRLARIKAPELKDPGGYESMMRLKTMLEQSAGEVRVEVRGREKYGRWLSDLYVSSGICINDLLVKEGFAVYA